MTIRSFPRARLVQFWLGIDFVHYVISHNLWRKICIGWWSTYIWRVPPVLLTVEDHQRLFDIIAKSVLPRRAWCVKSRVLVLNLTMVNKTDLSRLWILISQCRVWGRLSLTSSVLTFDFNKLENRHKEPDGISFIDETGEVAIWTTVGHLYSVLPKWLWFCVSRYK